MDNNLEENIDITVVFDPTVKDDKVVIKPLADRSNSTNGQVDSTKIEGIIRPIIKFNNRVIVGENIISTVLSYKGFTPSISVVLYDQDNLIQMTDSPGMNSELTYIMISQVEGNYKKIKMSFYVTSVGFSGSNVYINGTYKFLPIDQIKFKAFPKSNTYEFLKNIALETGLGFATTIACDSVTDNHYRLIQQKRYKDAIIQQMEFSGIDDGAILDSWIDLYGYINLVNLSHLFSTNIDINKLNITTISGGSTATDGSVLSVQMQETKRILSNFEPLTITNLKIQSFNTVVLNASLINDGTVKVIQCMNASGADPGYDNNIIALEINIADTESLDGSNIDDYNFKTYQFLGVEMDEVPILFQKEIRKKFLDKKRQKILEVSLNNYNLGLIRGMIVGVIIVDRNPMLKSINNNKTENSADSTVKPDQVTVNKSLSGLYYIDGEEILYKDEKFTQKLFLIKRGEYDNYFHSLKGLSEKLIETT